MFSNEELAPSIHHLTFALETGDSIEFEPGQYVTFLLSREGRTLARSYSICSSADQHAGFSLLVKRVPSGFASGLLCGLSPGPDRPLTVLAPLGRFVLHDPGGRSVVMIATGVGLAPFLPMLERLHRDHPTTPTWLFWGNRYASELVFRNDIERLATRWPKFRFVPVVSRPPTDGSWPGAAGHVEEHLRAQIPDLSSSDVYLCGANQMVGQTHELALELRASRSRIFADRWGDHTGESGA